MESFIAIISFSLLSLMFTAWIWIGWITPDFISKVKSKIDRIKYLFFHFWRKTTIIKEIERRKELNKNG